MYGKMKKMNTMKKGGLPENSRRKNVMKIATSDGGKIKIKYRKDGTVKKKVRRDASGKLDYMGKIKYNKDESKKKITFPKDSKINNKTSVPSKKRKYREGGSNDASYSYQDFLDL